MIFTPPHVYVLLLSYVGAIALGFAVVRVVMNRRRQRVNEDWKRYLRGRQS